MTLWFPQHALQFWLEQGVAGFAICDTDAAYSEKVKCCSARICILTGNHNLNLQLNVYVSDPDGVERCFQGFQQSGGGEVLLYVQMWIDVIVDVALQSEAERWLKSVSVSLGFWW